MTFRQRYSGQIFRSENVAQPDARDSGYGRPICRQMLLHPYIAAFARPARLIDYRAGIPYQLDIGPAQHDGNLDRVEQGQPFGLLTAAMADIQARIGSAARDRRDLHPAGIGPAAAVEEDPQTSRPHAPYRAPFTYVSNQATVRLRMSAACAGSRSRWPSPG